MSVANSVRLALLFVVLLFVFASACCFLLLFVMLLPPFAPGWALVSSLLCRRNGYIIVREMKNIHAL